MHHLAHTISQSGSRSELKRNKKRIPGAKSGYPSRIPACRAEFRSSDIGNVIPTLSRARFIIKFMASSGNRTLYVLDRQARQRARFFLALDVLREKSYSLFCPTGPIHAHRIARAESQGTRYSDHEGILLAPGTRESFTTRTRVANIDEASRVCLYNTSKRPSRQEAAPKELDGNDILASIRKSIYERV